MKTVINYLLSKKELKNLVNKSLVEDREAALEQARLSILKLSGHKCHNDDDRVDPDGNCDDCPCNSILKGNDKSSSSQLQYYKTWQLICNKSQ